MAEPPNALGGIIKAVRRAHGMSGMQFAVKLGVALDTLRSWEIGRSRATAAARRGAFSTTGLFPPTNPRSFRVRGMTVVVALSNSSTYKSLEVICPAGSRVFWSASNHLERDPQIWLVGFLCGQRPKDLDPIFIRKRHQLTHVWRRGRRQSQFLSWFAHFHNES